MSETITTARENLLGVGVADVPEEDPKRKALARPAGSPSPLRLGELLLRRALIDQNDLALALSEQDLCSQSPPLGRLLVRLGAIDEDVLTVTLAEQTGMRVIDLDDEACPDPSARDRLPREAAYRLQALPLRYENGLLVVALAEPPTREVRREISRLSGRQPDFVLATASLLSHAIERWYPHPSTVTVAPLDGADTTIDLELSADERRARPVPVRGPKPDQPRADASVHFQPDGCINVDGKLHDPCGDARTDDRVVTWLLSHAAELGARSVHLIEEPSQLRVRVRLDGRMRDTTILPATAGNILVRRMLRASGLEIDSRAVQSGWLRSDLPRFGPRLRVRTAETHSGRTVVIARGTDPAAGPRS